MNKEDKEILDSWCEMLDPFEETTDNVVWLIREIKVIRQDVMNNPTTGGTIALIAAYDSLMHLLDKETA